MYNIIETNLLNKNPTSQPHQVCKYQNKKQSQSLQSLQLLQSLQSFILTVSPSSRSTIIKPIQEDSQHYQDYYQKEYKQDKKIYEDKFVPQQQQQQQQPLLSQTLLVKQEEQQSLNLEDLLQWIQKQNHSFQTLSQSRTITFGKRNTVNNVLKMAIKRQVTYSNFIGGTSAPAFEHSSLKYFQIQTQPKTDVEEYSNSYSKDLNLIKITSNKSFLVNFILNMFQMIDSQFFQAFITRFKQYEMAQNGSEVQFDSQFIDKSFKQIQVYLEESLGKKMSDFYCKNQSYPQSQQWNKTQNQTQTQTQNQAQIQHQHQMNLLQIIKLQIYLSVQCKNKAYFIQTICQLPQKIQNKLMNHVTSTQTKLYNIIEVKQILSNILQTQEQNEELQKNILKISSENYKIEFQITESMNEQKRLLQQITQYNTQKEDLFKMLNITTLEQFIEIYKQIQQQTQYLESAIQEISERNQEIQKSNLQTISKINQNAIQITKANDSITSYKGLLKNLKDDISLYDQYCNNNNSNSETQQYEQQDVNDISGNLDFLSSFNLPSKSGNKNSNILRENNDIYNEKLLTFKMDQETNQQYSKQSKKRRMAGQQQRHSHIRQNSLTNADTLILQSSINSNSKAKAQAHLIKVSDLDENTKLNRKNIYTNNQNQLNPHIHINSYNQNILLQSFEEQCQQIDGQKQKYRKQLMIKLQHLYTQISAITKEITQFKQENKSLQKSNYKKQRKLRDLKNLHEAFVKQYEYNFHS